MIVDLVWPLIEGLMGFLASLLPETTFTEPADGGMLGFLAEVNSLLPIAGPIAAAAVAMSALAAFVAIRLILVAWRQVPFT